MVLAILATLAVTSHARAQDAVQTPLQAPAQIPQANAPAASRPLSEMLPLFEKNRCGEIRNPADQLFCGDPDLNNLIARYNAAVQTRLNRLADRQLAIEENVEWTAHRNSSCGIFRRKPVESRDFIAVKTCLLKETEERASILANGNYDCLAANTTAGMVICSDAFLAVTELELNGQVVGLIGKLSEDDAKRAFAQYARWIRSRDRKCGLADKTNVPLSELLPSETCLADDMNQKTAEIAAAKGDPKRIFAPHTSSPAPDADAVDLCVARIHSANTCENFLRTTNVVQIDSDVSAQEAQVTAEVEMIVLSPFAVCSPIASSCTGACWDPRSGQPNAVPGSRESLVVAHRLRIERAFTFQKTDNGNWRCNTNALSPIDTGVALVGP
jgi:uncharacterized protein YecT (DUF1311 family)